MIKLYRGLIDILVGHARYHEEEFSKHIRNTMQQSGPSMEFLGVTGFWNLMMEVTYILFTKFVFILGIMLTCTLAVVFFPLSAILTICSSIFSLGAAESKLQNQVEPVLDKKVK